MVLSQYYEAQQAVLGALLIEPDKLAGKIFREVSPDALTSAPLRHIFEAAKELYLSDASLDIVTIADRAGSGYVETMRQVMALTPTANNIDEHIRIVNDGYRLDRLHTLAEQMSTAASWADGKAALEQASRMLAVQSNRRVSSYTDLILRYLDRQGDGNPPWKLDWGIEALNKNIIPRHGWFVILGADSSVGKTALALQMALSMAKGGESVGFFSYETDCDGVSDRLLANAANVVLSRSKKKQLSDGDYQRVSAEGMKADKVKFTLIESSGYSVDDIRAEVLIHRFTVIFIDYVQLIPAGRSEDRWQVVTAVSMALHTMAQQLGVVVVGLSQVTPPEVNLKSGKRRTLRKSDLRESRQLVNDADVIMMMDLEDQTNPRSRRVLMIDKNKDGPLAKIYLNFDPDYMRFTSRAELPQQVKFEELPDDGDEIPF